MFNPLTPAEVVSAIGRAARDAARGGEEASEFSRGQLLSAYSLSRHLTVELDAYGPELEAFAADVAGWTAALPEAAGGGEALRALAARLEATADARELGTLTCELLDRLRVDESNTARELRARIQGRLRGVADREVELLAAVIEAKR